MGTKADQVASEIRVELRSALRQYSELKAPLSKFELASGRNPDQPSYFVSYDRLPRHPIIGLKAPMKSLTLPDERLQDDVLRYAGTVWHLKDHLQRWCDIQCLTQRPNAYANGKFELCVCSDLINAKKHGSDLSRPRSMLNPRLGPVTFDTSRSGVLEMMYDGGLKFYEVLVTIPTPIPFQINIESDRGVLGDAIEFIRSAFWLWVPFMESTGVLNGADRETEVLRSMILGGNPAANMV